MACRNGKLVLRYVGEHGQHTALYIDNELVAASYNCDSSIMLLLWCVADSLEMSIEEVMHHEYSYRDSKLGKTVVAGMFKVRLHGTYDTLMRNNAAALAYYRLIYKPSYIDPISEVLSAWHDVLKYTIKKFKLDNLRVQYELDEREIWINGGAS